MSNIKWLGLLILSFISLGMNAQVIKGKVIDGTTKRTMPGVNILVKRNFTRNSNGFGGNYEIKASQGAILEFSFIGYQTQDKKVGTSKVINIALQEDAQVLDDVVVIGYGVAKKKRRYRFCQFGNF